MLTATIELWPYGDQSSAKRLVTICIANIGRCNKIGCCDYVYTIDEPNPLFDDPIKAQGVIERYDRRNTCVAILARVLDDYCMSGGDVLDTMDDYCREVIESMRNKTNQ